ncbi:MAG: hypothetical protein ACPLPX_08325 [Candidatus Kapaibacteriota bacterium]|jgi:uncharacterized lipoprotein YajG
MKANSFFVLTTLLFLSIQFKAFPQAEIPTNKEIVISFLTQFCDSLANKIDTTKHKNIFPKIASHPLSDFLENILIDKMSSRDFKFYISNCDSCRVLQITINRYAINYQRVRRERPTKEISRKIELEIVGLVKSPETFVQSFSFAKTYKDTIKTDNFEFVEKDGNPFTSPKPKEPENFLKKYIEPILIIGSTALAALLFFTIRSK